ncbi:unnamed protein product [Adineta ricciae]|uniref:Uncharacterized protein n=1 Tax=Adineta ricciae TaxID=249248 RepID=A0A815N5T1_ADIRI|nr:unnamed protein product [Adineta ricciae]
MGAVGLVLVITGLIQKVMSDEYYCLIVQIPLGLFVVIWFIIGNVWVFTAKKTVQFSDPTNPATYCHSAVFNCAFVTIIITYVSLCCGICGEICIRN